MNKIKSSINHKWLLPTALVFALFFAMYSFLLKPVQQQMDSKQLQINQLSTEVFNLKTKVDEMEQSKLLVPKDVFTLRKKLPQDRELNELILRFEEIEYVSQVRIEVIMFNNYDVAVSTTGVESQNIDTQAGASLYSATQEDQEKLGLIEQPEQVPVSMIDPSQLPDELKMLTYELTVLADDEAKIERFLKEIEQMERVMRIDSISYALPGEADQLKEVTPEVKASIRVTTFYYDGEY